MKRTIHCPLCGAPSAKTRTTRERQTIITATHLCAEGHLWSERWTEAA